MASLAVIPARFRFMSSASHNLPLPADSQLTARGSFIAKTSFPFLFNDIDKLPQPIERLFIEKLTSFQ